MRYGVKHHHEKLIYTMYQAFILLLLLVTASHHLFQELQVQWSTRYAHNFLSESGWWIFTAGLFWNKNEGFSARFMGESPWQDDLYQSWARMTQCLLDDTLQLQEGPGKIGRKQGLCMASHRASGGNKKIMAQFLHGGFYRQVMGVWVDLELGF